MKIATIRLTATVIDSDENEHDGWIVDLDKSQTVLTSEKEDARTYQVEISDDPFPDDTIQQTIEALIGSLDSFDDDTAYAADHRIDDETGAITLLAAHVEIDEPYRRAVVSVKSKHDRDAIDAYLPRNYKVVGEVERFDLFGTSGVLIEGKDGAGWTLDDYVLPRLASGLHFGRELEDGELARWLAEGLYTPLASEITFDVIAELSYDPETDTLTEVN